MQPEPSFCLLQFLQECFTSREQGPPVVIGGAVQEFACSRTSSTGPTPSTGVSILGAHLPGRCLLIVGFTLCSGSACASFQQAIATIMKDAREKV